MAREIEVGRERALEAERLRAFRETARQVAHELKNPLTPIRFAVERLRREAPPALADVVDVLTVESRRLEEMARGFSAFGRLPDGPPSDVDVAELARYTARATVPGDMQLDLEIEEPLPMVRGHYEALARALSNVLINAVDACRGRPEPRVRVRVTKENGRADARAAVHIVVSDTGCGIPAERLARIWEPYVTTKPGGTGLGLAIARQTILAHDGSVEAASEPEPDRGTAVTFTLPAVDTTPIGALAS
jgi:signal transduction histidine kinase